jgi:hypothetical protein
VPVVALPPVGGERREDRALFCDFVGQEVKGNWWCSQSTGWISWRKTAGWMGWDEMDTIFEDTFNECLRLVQEVGNHVVTIF